MYRKIAAAVVTALVLATGASVANASARPNQGGWQVGGQSYLQERHDPTNTNGS
jgi:hypothetical protein